MQLIKGVFKKRITSFIESLWVGSITECNIKLNRLYPNLFSVQYEALEFKLYQEQVIACHNMTGDRQGPIRSVYAIYYLIRIIDRGVVRYIFIVNKLLPSLV